MSRCRWIAVLILCLGCTQTPQVEVPLPEVASTDFERLKPMLAGIQPGEVTLFEGLPSEFWEPELRQRELKQKKTKNIHGYAVYEKPSPLPAADADQLTTLNSTEASYAPHSGTKRCGEFFPEFCLEWKSDSEAMSVLISLECGEVKIFGPPGNLHCDLTPDAVEKLKKLLNPHRQNRPESAKPPS